MRRFSTVIAIAALTIAPLPYALRAVADEKPVPGPRELHVVGIYEGVTETDGKVHGPRSFVRVDRPGRCVTLVLTSYEPVTWYVEVTDRTEVESVILGGHGRQAVDGLPKETKVVTATSGSEKSLGYSYRRKSLSTRRLIRDLAAMTEVPVSSFQGSYRYRHEAPFEVSKVEDDPQLSVDYPKVTPVADLPDGADKLEFSAHHYVTGAVAFGPFSIRGPRKDAIKPLPDRVSRITYDPVGKRHYGIAGSEVVEIDLAKHQTKKLEVGLDVPPLSWPCEITFDTKRQRVILGTAGGGGYFYAYTPKTGAWEVISKRPGAIDAFTYSEKHDCLFGVGFEHGEDGNKAYLCEVNPQGALLNSFALSEPILPGSLATGPGVCTTQVALAGKYVAVLAAPGGHRDGADGWYTYLVDPETEKVWLTAKELAAKKRRD